MHEYGHYLQSQDYRLGYLFSVGVPSLISAMNSDVLDEPPFSTHRLSWMERSANRKAKEYFGENYGVDGGTLNSSNIEMESGSELIMRNNGIIHMTNGSSFLAPLGAVINIESGSIY